MFCLDFKYYYFFPPDLMMVHSLTFVLNELKSQIKSHSGAIKNIEEAKKSLSEQATDIQLQIDHDITGQLEAIHKQENNVLSKLDQIVNEESAALNKKREEFGKQVTELTKLLTVAEALGDNQGIRDSFERIMEDAIPPEDFLIDEYKIIFSANCKPLEDAVCAFGAVALHRSGKTANHMGECYKYLVWPENSDLPEKEIDSSKMASNAIVGGGNKISQAQIMDMQEDHIDEKESGREFCALSKSCNCIDVCEENMISIKPFQSAGKSVNLDKWLRNDASSVSEAVRFPASIVQYADEKFLSQLESLKLTDGQIDDCVKTKYAFEGVYLTEDLKKSELFDGGLDKCLIGSLDKCLIGKYEKCDINSKMQTGTETGTEIGTKISDDWNDIRRMPLKAWLKTSIPCGRLCEAPTLKRPTSKQIDKILCSPPHKWLKQTELMDIEDVAESDSMKASPSEIWENSCQKPLKYWLKQSFGGTDASKSHRRMQIMESFDEIQSLSLDNWLRPATSKFDLQGKTCSSPRSASWSQWLRSDHARATTSSKVHKGVKQFVSEKSTKFPERILRADLHYWLRTAPSSAAKSKHDLSKWLASGRKKTAKV